MSNEIEKDYETLVDEMTEKVEQAKKLLKEASELANRAGIKPEYYSDWQDLREVLGDFFGEENVMAWNSSDCYEDQAWNESGCTGN